MTQTYLGIPGLLCAPWLPQALCLGMSLLFHHSGGRCPMMPSSGGTDSRCSEEAWRPMGQRGLMSTGRKGALRNHLRTPPGCSHPSPRSPGKQLVLGAWCGRAVRALGSVRRGAAGIARQSWLCLGGRGLGGAACCLLPAAFRREAHGPGFDADIEQRCDKKAFKILESGLAIQFVSRGLLYESLNHTPFFMSFCGF